MPPTPPRRSNSPRLKVPRLDLTVRTQDITEADITLLKDLDAVAHLQRRSRSAVVADIVARALPPQFAHQVAAA